MALRFRSSLGLWALGGLFLLAFFPVWRGLVSGWWVSDDYSHGFLIPPLALFLVWRRRAELRRESCSTSRWGLAVVLLSLAVYILSTLTGVVTAASLSMISFLGGAVLYLFGWRMLRILLFPICFLLFMIPIPSQIYSTLTLPLQLFVSRGSSWLATLAGVPLVREGNLIHLPQQTLQVVGACSGLRSMMMLLALCALLGHLSLNSAVLRSLLLLAALPVALIVNVARVTVVILAIERLNFDLADGILHTILGLAVNLMALLMIFCLRGVLARWDRDSPKGW